MYPPSVLSFLTTEENGVIPTEISDKISENFDIKIKANLCLNAEIEKCKTNSDQQKFQLERELISLRKLLEEEGQQKSQAEHKLEDVQKRAAELDDNLKKANERINQLLNQLELSRTEQETTSSQSAIITGSLESRERLINELKNQIISLEEQLANAQKSKYEAIIKSEESHGFQVQFQYKERRYEQEKSMITRQMELLQKQLGERVEESLNLRSEHSCKTLNLQSELNAAIEEARIYKEERDIQQKTIDEKTVKVRNLLSSLHEATESEVKLEESFRQELIVKERLCTVYKDTSEDQDKRCQELEAGVEELRNLLQEASTQYGALEKAKKRSEEDAQEQLNKSHILIKELKEEVEKVNRVLEANTKKDDALLEMSPAASAASHLMKKGLTLSQLYTEYMNTTDRLFQVEDDNKRLNRYVNQILQEIEDKAPLLNKQRDDYHRALETIETLHNQVDNSIDELEKQRQDAEDSHRRASFLGRENGRLSQQIKDLSKQVTILLTQVEAARAGIPAPPISVLEDISNPTCAGDVITDRLVAFRDVSELQQQNAKLLASLRELTDKLESVEKSAVESKTQELQDELKQANCQLQELKTSREKLQTMIESLIKQRDLYKTMNSDQSMTMQHHGLSPTISSTPRPRGMFESQEVSELKKELNKVTENYDEYRKERGINGEMERSEREKLKVKFEKFRSENIKLILQAEYNEERIKTLNGNCEAFQRQVNALEEKCSTLQGIVGRHESTIDSLREQCMKLSKQLSHAEVMSFNLREEKSLLKENEARLLAERESLHHTNSSQHLILSNLEAIKNNLERTDYETKTRLDTKITDLTTQCARLKSKLESNSDLQEAQLRLMSLEEQLKISKEDTVAAKKALLESEATLAAARIQITEAARSPLQTGMLNRSRVSPVSSPGLSSPRGVVGQSTRELEVQLAEERAKTQALQASVNNIQQKNDQLNSMCNQQETQLIQATTVNKEADQLISQIKSEVTQHEADIKTLSEKLKTAEENEIACKDSLNHQIEEITQALEMKNIELASSVTHLEELNETEVKHTEQMKQQLTITSEAQDKYEREMMLHAADLKALSVLKEKWSTQNDSLDQLIAAKVKAENILTEKQSGLEIREAEIKKSNENLKNRVIEMEEQNQSLLNQFTQLSDKMASIQNKLTSQTEGAPVSFTDDEARSTDQLREVIKYLRREKELSVHKVEVAQAETQRLEAQKKSLESQIGNVSKNLTEERVKNQASIDNASRFGEMMRKVQTVDALADSNKLLRNEKDSLKGSLDEMTAKVASLMEQILPLQEKQRALTTQNDTLLADKSGLEEEKERFRKRTQDLVEKLNRAKPEDMIKLQQELGAVQSSNLAKDSEINRLKNLSNHLQKTQQAVMANKNQLQSQLESSREESKKIVEDGKRMSQEKMRLQQQVIHLTEKNKNLESVKQLSYQTHQLEIQKSQEQIMDVRQKEEARRTKELDALKKDNDNKIKDLEDKNESLEKQTTQLRKIATKYKRMAAEAVPESSEATEDDLTKSYSKDERVKLLEERLMSLQQQLNSESTAEACRVQPGISGVANIIQQESSVKENKIQDISHNDETGKKMTAYESRIMLLEKEREQQLQKVETLNKKLSMQQKQLENIQKQSTTASKASTCNQEKTSEAPPTANIKPMAAPAQPASVRSQGASQMVVGLSRTIPTASIRPLTPSIPGQGTSTVGIVSPLETLVSGGDGAVSSTVTLPQATVTPTPAIPTTVATAFPSTLTATVSPTPVSSSIAASGAYPQQFSAIGTTQPQAAGLQVSVSESGPSQVQLGDEVMEHSPEDANDASADAFINQAIAMRSPELDDDDNSSDSSKDQPAPSGSHKRKLDDTLDEDECDNKRSKVEDDSGEPSSSSNVKKSDDCEELIVIASDDEELIHTSERDEDMEEISQEGDNLIIASVHGGSEAELRMEQSRDDESDDRSEEVQSSFSQPERSIIDQEQPSSSRQSFPHFSQITQFEEGMEDRIVPSTPTLVIQPSLDGQSADGVSSLQVPSQDFVFSTGISQSSEVIMMSRGGLSQISEGEIIDVTRVDLGQLQDSQKVVPMLPSGSMTPELTSEGSISSSAGEGSRGEIAGSSGSLPQFVENSSNKQEEPDSGVDESDQNQDVVELEDYDQSAGTSDDLAVRGVHENEDNISIESVSPLRATRSSVSQSLSNYGQSRRITPITWDDRMRPGRGGTRGRLMHSMPVRGHGQRFPARPAMARGQRARRSRGTYGRGQM